MSQPGSKEGEGLCFLVGGAEKVTWKRARMKSGETLCPFQQCIALYNLLSLGGNSGL